MSSIRKPVLVALSAITLAMWTSSAAAQSVVRAPYLQSLTPTSVFVVWTTDTATDARVRYGTDPQNLTQTADLSAAATQHEVLIQHLAPNTRYYYSVGTSSAVLAGGDATFYFETAPAVGARKKFRAWIVGDSGYNHQAPREVRDAMLGVVGAYRPQLFLHMGDMAYNSGSVDEFTNNFFGIYPSILRNTVIWPAFGNHEGISADSGTQTGPYYSAYVLPMEGEAGGLPSGTEAYYSFDYANVHFIVLDTYGTSLNPTGAMLTWAQADLAATQQDWIVGFWHHPPYTRGTHDSDTDEGETEVRERVMPIFEAGGVDLVLSGHSHIYERSFLVNGAYDTPTTAQGHILDPGDGKPLGDGPYVKLAGNQGNDGAVYVVAGHGAYAGGPGDHPLMYFSEPYSGSCVLDVQDNRLSLSNIRSDGVISDRFAMLKGPGLVVAVPDGGERLPRGGSTTIRWATTGSIPTVRLEHSLDNGATWTTIVNALANTGRFTWTLPAIDTTQALIRVSDAANASVSDESNAGFTIRNVPQTAVFFGDYWVYDDSGVDRGAAWRGLAYDDTGWKAGAGQLGFGDGDESTVLAHTLPAYPTAYFRKIITIDGAVSAATLKVMHDDGVLVWVNGVQVLARFANASNYADFASQGSLDNQTTTVSLTGAPFVSGSNVIAAMVKQSDAGSTDLSFDMELTVTTSPVTPPAGGGSASSSSSATTSSASSSSSSAASSSSSSSTGSGGVGGSGGGGAPVCVTVQRGVNGAARDATIWQNTPGYRDGTSISMYTGTGTEGVRSSLLWFDLAFIPAGAQVASATLTMNQGYKTAQSTVRAHRVLADWGETTVSWSSFNSQWDPLVAGSFISGNGSGDRTVDLTQLVQGWANGQPNYGLLLEEDPAQKTQLRSSEEGTVSRRPGLQVCYATPPPPATASVGDRVWSDDDGDGAQDVGETGIAGVSVELSTDAACNGSYVPSATTVTDAGGLYGFSSLSAGCYRVAVSGATVPAGYALTTDRSAITVTLAAGQGVVNADFGYRPPPPPPPPATGTIGDRVWSDDDGDGVQDAGETGVTGVSVDLYTDAACNGSYALSGTEVTDSGGLYTFPHLAAGCYGIAVNAGTLPAGYVRSTPAASLAITLSASQGFVDADFGYRPPHPALSLATTVSLGGACPGQEVVNVLPSTGVTWCYRVTNTGDVDVENITVRDDQVGAVPGAAVTLAPGASHTFSRAGVANAGITVAASVTGVDVAMSSSVQAGPDTALVNVVHPGIDLDVTVSSNGSCPGQDAASVPFGTSVLACYRVSNLGTEVLTDVDVYDGPGDLIGTVADMAPGTSVTLAGAPVAIGNDATVTGSAVGTDAFGYEVYHTDTAPIHVLIADLAVQVTAPASVVTRTCAQVPYTIRVTNVGQAPAAPTVTDTLPAGIAFVSATVPGGSCASSAGRVTCTLASLAPAASATVSMVTIPLATAGAITNTVTVTSATRDASAANDTNSAVTTLSSPTLAGWQSVTSNFSSGTAIPAGRTIWFTSVMRATGLPLLGTATVKAASGHITFSAGGRSYDVLVPSAEVLHDGTVTSATTTFDAAKARWMTRAPKTFSGNTFLSAVAFTVPVSLPGGISGVNWSQYIAADRTGISVRHAWAAAVYTSFNSDYNALGVKAIDDRIYSVNSDPAGTPESFRVFVTSGARGGGGTNYIGTLTGNVSGTPVVDVCN